MGARKIWATSEGDALVAYIARVSNPENQSNPSVERLMAYMIKHRHWSPFEMVNLCVEVECSAPIAEQILRHRSMSFQKFSFRYSDVDSLGLAPTYVRARRPGKTNRQASAGEAPRVVVWAFLLFQVCVWHGCLALYRLALRLGVPREQARFLLPMMLTTRMYINGTVRSWIHYLSLRLAEDTQGEHRDIAGAIWDILQAEFPVVAGAIQGSGVFLSKSKDN